MIVTIPDFDYKTKNDGGYPGGILPGVYDLAVLLREHVTDSEAILFIADMVE